TQCRRRRGAGLNGAVGREEHGDQGGRPDRSMGAARPHHLRARPCGATPLRPAACRSHASEGELALRFRGLGIAEGTGEEPRGGTEIAQERLFPEGCGPRETIMRMFNLLATIGGAALLTATATMPVSAASLANAQLKDSSGIAVGDADLVQTDAGVLIKLQLKGMKPGEHAFHIH